MKAIEKAQQGKVVNVPDDLIDKLIRAGVYIQIQVADEDNEPVEALLLLWQLPAHLFGRTMDNNEGRDKRYTSNGYFYDVPEELLAELQAITQTKKHVRKPKGFRVSGLATCLGVLFKYRTFRVKAIESAKSPRRRLMHRAIRDAANFLPMFENPLAEAMAVHKVKNSFERNFPRSRKSA